MSKVDYQELICENLKCIFFKEWKNYLFKLQDVLFQSLFFMWGLVNLDIKNIAKNIDCYSRNHSWAPNKQTDSIRNSTVANGGWSRNQSAWDCSTTIIIISWVLFFSLSLCTHQRVFLSSLSPSHLSLSLPIYLSICLPIHPSIHPSIHHFYRVNKSPLDLH